MEGGHSSLSTSAAPVELLMRCYHDLHNDWLIKKKKQDRKNVPGIKYYWYKPLFTKASDMLCVSRNLVIVRYHWWYLPAHQFYSILRQVISGPCTWIQAGVFTISGIQIPFPWGRCFFRFAIITQIDHDWSWMVRIQCVVCIN